MARSFKGLGINSQNSGGFVPRDMQTGDISHTPTAFLRGGGTKADNKRQTKKKRGMR